jgi:hypothetical protein
MRARDIRKEAVVDDANCVQPGAALFGQRRRARKSAVRANREIGRGEDPLHVRTREHESHFRTAARLIGIKFIERAGEPPKA